METMEMEEKAIFGTKEDGQPNVPYCGKLVESTRRFFDTQRSFNLTIKVTVKKGRFSQTVDLTTK